MPTAGRDYPGSYGELLAWFPDEPACLDYLEWLRWPEGIRCPRCGHREGWRLGSGRWECTLCGRQASVTAGTIFHRSRTPLGLWFAAAWQITSQKNGVSALGVQRSLGLGSFQTAWAMLHRYRAAMVRPGRGRLSGHVEVDEAYVGGVESSGWGRRTETKAIVAIAVEIENPKGYRSRARGYLRYGTRFAPVSATTPAATLPGGPSVRSATFQPVTSTTLSPVVDRQAGVRSGLQFASTHDKPPLRSIQ